MKGSDLAVSLTADQLAELVRKEVDAGLDRKLARLSQPLASLNTEEAGAFLKLNVVALRKFARAGEIPSFRIGSLLRFDVADLEQWKNERKGKR